jgi:hypothetical protein
VLVATVSTASDLADVRTVVLCHKPGTPAEKTLTLPSPAASAHFGHGDVAGSCSSPEDEETQEFSARLSGLEEVPPISTAASGRFRAEVTAAQDEIAYRLTYTNLESEIAQAHIHFAQRRVNGGIVVWLCANPAVVLDAPAGTPECSGNTGVVEATITSTSVVGVTGQGIDPGDLEAVLRAMLAGAAYVNVHTSVFGSGEIRGQIH